MQAITNYLFPKQRLQYDIVSLLPSEGVTATEETTPQAKWKSMKNQFVKV